ncbi:hypothetical protein [Rossellomorea marisflavi]|uniref:hypothetical protein n=1 Tax=Rossellomorea marisflavi TaxID=189381 RepID=UPI001EE37ED8|nr:hypothetical protein [Rossellomorea marisflavi]UKS64102.1 hypothetical protein K6T23_14845 [Rossellomorea marisflavi]
MEECFIHGKPHQQSQSGLKRKGHDSDGKREMIETPEAQLRRLDFLPAESWPLQRKGTINVPMSLSSYKEGNVQDSRQDVDFMGTLINNHKVD